jgi:recombinational DNA repair ATPase RecF
VRLEKPSEEVLKNRFEELRKMENKMNDIYLGILGADSSKTSKSSSSVYYNVTIFEPNLFERLRRRRGISV